MPNFIPYPLTHGLLADLSTDEFPTQLRGWNNGTLYLPNTGTHFGYIQQGGLDILDLPNRGFFSLKPGMYFSLPGAGTLLGGGQGIVITRLGYKGMFSIGGPKVTPASMRSTSQLESIRLSTLIRVCA